MVVPVAVESVSQLSLLVVLVPLNGHKQHDSVDAVCLDVM